MFVENTLKLCKPHNIRLLKKLIVCNVNLCRVTSNVADVQSVTPDFETDIFTPSLKPDRDTLSEADYSSAKAFRDIPGPKGLPYIGTLLSYTLGPHSVENLKDAILHDYHKYGKIMKETINGRTIVHLFDPDDIKTIFSSEGKTPHIPPLMETTQKYRDLRQLSLGLGNTNGEEWYRLRSSVQQMMMRPREVTIFLPKVQQVAEAFVRRLKRIRNRRSQIENFMNEIFKSTYELSGLICFERRLGALDAGSGSRAQHMIDANQEIFDISSKLKYSLPLFKMYDTPMWKKLLKAEDYFYSVAQALVDETVYTIHQIQETCEIQGDQYHFMQYLLSKPELSKKDVSIIALSLFSDGLNTTSPTLAFNLYCLATNPEVQDKLCAEIEEHVPRKGPVTGEALNRMTFLKACVKEAFRFFPVGLEVSRIPQKDMVLGGYQIPAGTQVEMNNFVMFMSPEYFSEPARFLPERWLREGSANNIHPYVVTPFGHGPRMCAGRRFAELELYMMLIKLLQKFTIGWKSEVPLKQKYRTLLIPDGPLEFTFKDRSQK